MEPAWVAWCAASQHRPSGIGEDRNAWVRLGWTRTVARCSTDLPGSVRIATAGGRATGYGG